VEGVTQINWKLHNKEVKNEEKREPYGECLEN